MAILLHTALSPSSASASPRLAIVSPYDLSAIDEIELQDWPAAEQMLKKAVATFGNRSQWLPAHARLRVLEKLATAMEAEAEHFATLIAREGGKPITDARIEVSRAIGGVRLCAQYLPHALTADSVPAGLSPAGENRRMTTTREPLGVVLAISAFNHPLNLLIHQAVTAIAVGCPVIVKPALATPLTARLLVELIHASGLPEPWCQLLVCTNEIAEKLAADPRLAYVNFIGSASVGWRLRGQLAAGVRCSLEHGGNAPVLLLPYANQDEAIPALLKGGMTHAGQVCVSVQRVYVPWAEGGHFARKLGEAAEQLVVGNPLHDATQVGPLISAAATDRVHEWVMEAIGQGAKLMCGGQKVSDTVYQPTVLFDPPDDAKVTREEIFGPVICVYGYDELDDAIRRANLSAWHFQAAVWGRQYDEVCYAAERLNASSVMVNDHTAFRVDHMPFGGRGASGLGVGGIPHSMAEYLQHKLLVQRV